MANVNQGSQTATAPAPGFHFPVHFSVAEAEYVIRVLHDEAYRLANPIIERFRAAHASGLAEVARIQQAAMDVSDAAGSIGVAAGKTATAVGSVRNAVKGT